MSGVVYATADASVAMPGGYTQRVRKGSHWRADDPLVLDHPDLFSADPRWGMSYSSPQLEAANVADDPVVVAVESATAAPGERRPLRRPA
jgi:hypothetical protein